MKAKNINAKTIDRRPGKAQTLLGIFPKIKKILIILAIVIAIPLTIAILTVFSPTSQKPTGIAHYTTEKFTLPPCDETGECEEVPTVDAGPGTRHRIRADTPYQAISVQSDGSRKIYPMPAGWESWSGAAPAGKLRLMNTKGAKTQTFVEVLRVQ